MKKRGIKAAMQILFLFLFTATAAACTSSPKEDEVQRESFRAFAENKVIESAEGVRNVRTIQTDGNTLYAVDYPSVTENSAVSAQLKAYADRTIGEFQALISEERKAGRGGLYAFTMTYKPYTTADSLLSIKFTANCAQGDDYNVERVDAFVYDLSSGKQLSLSDIFDPNKDYLSAIAAETKTYLSQNEVLRQNLDEALFESGTSPAVENYSQFAVTPQKIIFYFNEGAIAPKSAGTFEVGIPFSKLSGVLSPRMTRMLESSAVPSVSQPVPAQTQNSGDPDESQVSESSSEPDDDPKDAGNDEE